MPLRPYRPAEGHVIEELLMLTNLDREARLQLVKFVCSFLGRPGRDRRRAST